MRKTIILLIINLLFSSCDYFKDKRHDAITRIMSEYIDIPYENFECWTNDSLTKVAPWKQAKIKLIQYIDSTQCPSCYLHKIALQDEILYMEHYYKENFFSVFIIAPRRRDREKLYAEFSNGLLPMTLFIDTAHVFMDSNPKLPEESMLHTFLLDENDKVILVGNPMTNQKVKDLMVTVIERKLGKKLYNENIERVK